LPPARLLLANKSLAITMNVTFGGKGRIVRHAAFEAANNTTLSPAQINSNKLNTVGRPREEACNGCFKAMGLVRIDHEFGRGMMRFNEVFRYG
jgi:hypothetical protein